MRAGDLLEGVTLDVAIYGHVIARVPMRWLLRMRVEGCATKATLRIVSAPAWIGRLLGASVSARPMRVPPSGRS